VTKSPEDPRYAPLDEPEGSGVKAADMYLYRVQGYKRVVLCPACARQLRTDGKQVMVLKVSSGICERCNNNQHSGRVNE
jgi:hypothetical protein